MRVALLSLCLILTMATAPAVANEGGATYQRNRASAMGRQRGGGWHGHGGAGWGYGGWGYGGFYQPPAVYGSWYQRPYPTHLDFFRLRQRTPLPVPHVECPHCSTDVTPLVTE